MTELSPTEYRANLDAWRLEFPEDKFPDSKIMPKPRQVISPRHAKIADAVRSLLAWRDIVEPPEILQTNFLHADTDNGPTDKGDASPKRDVESELEIRPSVDELIAAVANVKFAKGLPVKGDPNVDYAPSKNGYAPVLFLGGLEFNCTDSNQRTGTDATPHRGEIVNYLSGGKWRKPKEKAGTPKGSAPDIVKSNAFYAQLLNAKSRQDLPRVRRRPTVAAAALRDLPPTTLSLASARAWCGLPPAPANDNRAAMPWRPASARDLFMGGSVACKPPGNTAPPNDPEVRLDRLQTASAAASIMSSEDQKLLDRVLTSGDFESVGISLGFNGKNAERRGKESLMAATQRLSTFLKEIAA